MGRNKLGFQLPGEGRRIRQERMLIFRRSAAAGGIMSDGTRVPRKSPAEAYGGSAVATPGGKCQIKKTSSHSSPVTYETDPKTMILAVKSSVRCRPLNKLETRYVLQLSL